MKIEEKVKEKEKEKLFMDKLPITCENFRCLCTGETGLGYYLKPRWYKNSPIHRIVTDFFFSGNVICINKINIYISIFIFIFIFTFIFIFIFILIFLLLFFFLPKRKYFFIGVIPLDKIKYKSADNSDDDYIIPDIEKPLLEKDISINENSDFNELRNMYKYNKHF
ncbi:hypothetical protein PFMC_03590 [Plasmodium falciparum CAMP/Malaysia]|uniref:PPIase cyclophilin-type domain-containing protein n=1 Tax=Plasmodium falciparum (isolate Camp / Malaysia) TaxID=5835 RepID=A0A024X6X2_PLAFC|nr:hypothetical protein PFMC_03590 [Plasmodium falciparum CAMP/Malaysia]